MAEGGEGEDEIQFLRTVSRFAAACTQSAALVTGGNMWSSFFFVVACVCMIMTVDCLSLGLPHRCLFFLLLFFFNPLAFDNPVPSCKILRGGDAPLFCASLTDSYCLFLQSLSQEVDSTVSRAMSNLHMRRCSHNFLQMDRLAEQTL